MKKKYANLLLLLVSVIWGGGFIFVQILLDSGVPAGMITMMRGGIFAVCAFALFFKRIIKMTLKDLKVGLIAGVTNAFGFLFQAIGQSMTSASHASLITIIYVVAVPVFCFIFYRIKLKLKTIISVIICVLGAFLLVSNFDGGFDGRAIAGDALVLAGAVMLGANIAYLGHSGKETHYGTVSFFMGATLFLTSLVYVLVAGEMRMPEGSGWKIAVSIAYLGILSSTLCQILQVLCQRYTSPVSASMIMTLEGFFGGTFALLYGDAFTWRLLAGGLLIIFSVLMHEFDFSVLFRKKEEKDE